MRQGMLPFCFSGPATPRDTKGVVYTKPWAVEWLLDLAGYTPDRNLADAIAVEPAAGEGAFLIPMARRLVASCRKRGRPLTDCAASLLAYELDETRVGTMRQAVVADLRGIHVGEAVAEALAAGWVTGGDYLLDVARLPRADYVLGNPPYIRLEEIPEGLADLYRTTYRTMNGRADVYVAFFEAALRQLKPGGVCAYICADRWMLNQYGAGLRSLVTGGFGVEVVVEMHDSDAFDAAVSAYPAITVIRRGPQGRAVVASVGRAATETGGGPLASSLLAVARGEPRPLLAGVKSAVVDQWFAGSDPWPCSSPARLALLRRLEERFAPLESEGSGTKVGIGVATGLDEVFITDDPGLVEGSRLLPLAMSRDTVTGRLEWSGHYLVNPWADEGLVDLDDFPRLRAYFEGRAAAIRKRNVARKNPGRWYRTIDRVSPGLAVREKLYIPDIKETFHPVLDRGETYPHHNLYFLVSELWDLEVLGGLLLSGIGQLFIEAYGLRMRGGYLRFQAQYLRRIRVPRPDSLPTARAAQLVDAFRRRDVEAATGVALEIYGVAASELEDSLGR